jgi:hypothetical protein
MNIIRVLQTGRDAAVETRSTADFTHAAATCALNSVAEARQHSLLPRYTLDALCALVSRILTALARSSAATAEADPGVHWAPTCRLYAIAARLRYIDAINETALSNILSLQIRCTRRDCTIADLSLARLHPKQPLLPNCAGFL